MIPTPPCDPGLSALPALFDGDAVAEIIAGALGVEVTGCTPRYVRYKPETSCLVQYDLAFRGGGPTRTTGMSIRAFAGNRAQRRAASAKMATLVDHANRLHGPSPVERTAWLPGVGGILQVHPVDYDLPYLTRATSAAEVTAVLRGARPDGGDLAIAAAPELVRYKPGRKALLRYTLADDVGGRLYGKVHAEIGASLLIAQTRALICAGIPTPPVLGADWEHGFVAHAEATGVPLASLRGMAGYSDWIEPLVETLFRLHDSGVPGHAHRIDHETATIAAGCALLARIVPHLAGHIDRIHDQVAARLAAVNERLATVHGDFYDDQALVSDVGVTILDLDELRRGHPLLDVGNMLAHLAVADARGDDTGAARDALLANVRRSDAHAGEDIAAFEASALLKLAPGPFRRLEPDWPMGIERILSLAETRLADDAINTPPLRRTVPQRLADDALPQLRDLLDTGTMTERLIDVLGGAPVSVTDAEVVRHKPGRRAIVRYAVEQHGSRTMLYGKSFASERGPKVHEITSAIAAARGFGRDVALPDPVAYLPDLKLLLQRSVAGEPVEAALLDGDERLAGRNALALLRFHHCGLDLGRAHHLETELAPLPERVAQVGAVCAELGERAEACLASAHWRDLSGMTWRRRPVHRDFYHDQILIDGDRLAVLDLDDAAMSEPAVDVANFAAHLMLLGAQRRGDAGALAPVVDRFLDVYTRLDSELDLELLRFLIATTLVRLAGIHVSRTDGAMVAGLLLARAAELLRVEAATGVGC